MTNPQSLVKEIKEAFAGVSYPGDDDLVSTPEHRAACDECQRLYETFRGVSWKDALQSDDWIGPLGHGMSFFTAAAWRYYLPAHLIHAIECGVVGSLELRPRLEPELVEHSRERAEKLTVRQTAALLEYLRFVVEQEVHEVLREGHREALVCWEAILGEKRRARDNAG